MCYTSTMVSGKFVLRLDPQIHKVLKEEAKLKGCSLNTLCESKLQGLTVSPWHEITSKIVKIFNPNGIILFGSTARGEQKPSSDIDLLVVMPKSTLINRTLYYQWDKEFQFNDKISPQFVHLPTRSEIGSIWLECSIDGEILYDPKGDIKRSMQIIRQLISQGVYQQKISHGHSYWVRQAKNAK